MRKAVVTLAGLTVALMSVASPASAALPDQHPTGSDGHDFSFTGDAASQVTIEYKPRKDKFAGAVSSDFVDTARMLEDAGDEAAVCVVGRTVTVYRYRRDRADRVIGSDTVNDNGRWSVAKSKVDGRYYASVSKDHTLLREYYGGIDYYVSCLADTSGKIRL